ncbi:hypothetical protein [Mycoplasmopsis maculosa]|nr:hypothetical protein [Mycoplasmopsis maculosa]
MNENFNIDVICNELYKYNYKIDSIDFFNNKLFLNVSDFKENQVCQFLIEGKNKIIKNKEYKLKKDFLNKMKEILKIE